MLLLLALTLYPLSIATIAAESLRSPVKLGVNLRT